MFSAQAFDPIREASVLSAPHFKNIQYYQHFEKKEAKNIRWNTYHLHLTT